MENLNTHHYDGKIGDLYKKMTLVQDNNDDYKTYDKSEKKIFDEISDSLQHFTTDRNILLGILKMLKMLVTDRNNNYDRANDIDALDILCRTWYYVRKEKNEDRKTFFEQIYEINNGSCPQGRTTRIFQIYKSYF